jgi:hypothetical protein
MTMLASFLASIAIDTSMVSELVFSDVLSIAQTIGIIGTLASFSIRDTFDI